LPAEVAPIGRLTALIEGGNAMSLRVLALANLIVGLVFGVALLAAPAFLLGTYSLPTTEVTLLVARLMGAEFLGLNVVTLLLLPQLGSLPVRRALVVARGLSEGAGAVVALIGKLGSIGNVMLWSVPALYGIFALGYLYFLLRLPRDAKA
jgi:hypothetical protein